MHPPSSSIRALCAAALLGLCGALAACSGEGDGEARPGEGPPNVLLISIDSLRADHLGCYGHVTPTGEKTSPHLDRVAEQGVLFERCVSTTSWTLPAHHALLSGLPDLLHGAFDDNHGPSLDRIVLPEALAEAGWSTTGFYSGPYLHPAYGFERGFQRYENCGVPSLFDLDEAERKDAAALLALELRSHRKETSSTVTRRALETLDEVAGDDRPFFLFLHYFDVHYDYDPPSERYAKQFWRDYRRPPVSGLDFLSNPAIHPGMDPAVLEGVLSYYDGEIHYVDEQIGRVLDHLAALDLDAETLVVITADHGDEFFEHGHKGHRQNLHRETLHVPLILRLPGRLEAGARVRERVSLIDITPTVLDLCSVRPDGGVQDPLLRDGMLGRSLRGMDRAGGHPPREQVGGLADVQDDADGRSDSWALWTDEHKVVVRSRWSGRRGERSGETVEAAVYDLADDPGELAPRTAPWSAGSARAIERYDRHLAALYALAGKFRAGPPPTADAAELAALREQLRALGYMPEGEAGDPPEGRVDRQPPPTPFPRGP